MIKGEEAVQRSKKVVFVSYCMLFQSVRAQGVAIKFRAAVNPVMKLLIDNDINIVQMSCPEISYEGIIRKAVRKDAYDNPEFRAICERHAKQVTDSIKILRNANFNVIGILGIENSPTCGVEFVFREGKGRSRESGIFVEELQKLLLSENLGNIPLIGIEVFNIKKSLLKLKDLIFKQSSLVDFTRRPISYHEHE